MNIRRALKSELVHHDGLTAHRQICRNVGKNAPGRTLSLRGAEVVLSQMKPGGLWRFTSLKEDGDAALDKEFGEMPLKVAIAKLRLLT